MATAGEITGLLQEAAQGDRAAFERLIPLVYDDLHRLAHHHRWRFGDPRAPGTTSLVHEAFMKIGDLTQLHGRTRGQFFCVAAKAMRSILIDNARRHSRRKREGRAVPVEDVVLVSEERSDELLALDEALERLDQKEARLARIVECRFFAGLTIDETAEALEISPATVKRGWDEARVRLYKDLHGGA